MSKEALLNVNQLAARKGAAELEFAVKKVHSLDASKGCLLYTSPSPRD